MSNIQIYKKPELQILSEKPKFRSMNEEQRNGMAHKIVEKLSNMLGVSSRANENHVIETIGFIAENYPNHSPDEIIKAFQLALSGKLDVELFQQLNSIVIGKVMKMYDRFKLNELSDYRRKQAEEKAKSEFELSEEQKRAINNKAVLLSLDYYLENGSVDKTRLYVYDTLVKRELLSVSNEEKSRMYRENLEIVRNEYQNAKSEAKTSFNKSIFEEFSNKLSNLGQSKNQDAINKCKEQLLMRFFMRLNTEEKINEFKAKFDG